MNENPDTMKQQVLYARAAATFGAAIERLARGYEADPDLRRDLVQEIHVALWRSFAAFDGRCSERSWVYRVAHNIAAGHIRAHRRRKTLVDLTDISHLPSDDDLETATGERRILAQLTALILKLKPIERQVMLLYLEGLSAAEIAEITGLSAGAVAVRIHRIKAFLSARFNTEEAT
jgi:RNA polymerase sigma-70 factor (ECF subfamily)